MRPTISLPWSSFQALLRRSAAFIHRLVTGACFWTAVLFPLLYVPLLLSDLPARSKLGILLIAVVLDIMALVLSHSYRPGSRETADLPSSTR